MPIFTIATVTLNNLNGLKRTHTSVAAQTCTDFEWLVQDGASNDGSIEYLSATSAQTESKKDSGIYAAMNRLIERSTGDYIIFMNAGDTFAGKDTLKLLQQTIAQNTPDFLYGDALENLSSRDLVAGSQEDPSVKPQNDIVLKKARPLKSPLAAAKYGMFTHHQSMLYKRKKIGALRYNETYQIAADYDFTCRYLLSLNCHPRDFAQQNSNSGDPESELQRNPQKPLYIPSPICIFESGGISQQKSTLGRAEQFQIRKALNLCPPLQNHLITTAQFLNWQLRHLFPSIYWKTKNH